MHRYLKRERERKITVQENLVFLVLEITNLCYIIRSKALINLVLLFAKFPAIIIMGRVGKVFSSLVGESVMF